MRREDVGACVEIIAAHPVIARRYGSAIDDLRAAWVRLLGCEAKTANVFEKIEGSGRRVCFVGVSVFVTDDFVRELKTPPLFWFGPELVRRVGRARSPVLSDEQLAAANTSGGLNLLVWEGCFHPAFACDLEIPRLVMDAFIEHHKGFRWKELISSQLETGERLGWTLNSGSLWWDADRARYGGTPRSDVSELASRPHIVGVTRDLEMARRPWSASWVGTLFDYEPPRFAFTRTEQRLLLSAISGDFRTDQELSANLGLGVPAVKKAWLSIYDRVAARDPQLLVDKAEEEEAAASRRGKEKRRRLLAYLRRHPEELRPVSRPRQARHVAGREQLT
jgi:hypothetical protein